MKRIREFVITLSLGGLVVILPLIVLYKVFAWLLQVLNTLLLPLTHLIIETLGFKIVAAELLSFVVVFVICFILGAIVRTKLGGWLHTFFEQALLHRIPGYSTVKDIVQQFTGGQQGLFRQVVRVSLGDNGPYLTGFLTDEYPENQVTIFVPTGPNPTSGLILHTSKDKITVLDVSVETAIKTILSCGAGSGALLKKTKQPI